ncbi:MAG: NAD(P)/FAD-dependent oxidoreductase [Thermodesulfobacteriota bacterium]
MTVESSKSDNIRGVAVIGGGAAGLMAAGQAALRGSDVVVFEKMGRPGRKICITGKGRCNITNIAELPDFLVHFGPNGRFLRQAFSCFFAPELMEFFETLGLDLVIERGGRVFPASGLAPDVLRALLKWARAAGVEIKTKSVVDALIIEDGSIKGLVSGDSEFLFRKVILATGGVSYPETGSTGDGYKMAEEAGHKIVELRPALVGLETAGDSAGRLAGLDLLNVGVRFFRDAKLFKEGFGEMGFSEGGVLGPVILTLSSAVVDALKKGRRITLSIDLKPALDNKKLDARLLRDFKARATEPLTSLLRGLLPVELVPLALEFAGLDPMKTASQVTKKERADLIKWLKDFTLDVTGPFPFEGAIVTAGGVDIKEIDPRTMESRLVKGLFITGELLDIQGDTGGYNLQAAFSTGYVAGVSAAAG